MEYVRKLTSQFTKANTHSSETSRDTVFFLTNRSGAAALQAPCSASWSFEGLDKQNSLDDEGDDVITGEKRHGRYQEITQPHKRMKFEDSSQVPNGSKDIQNHSASSVQFNRTSVTQHNPHSSGFTNQRPLSTVPVSSSRTEISRTPSQATSTATPFIINDDSDEDNTPSPPDPPPSSSKIERNKALNLTGRAKRDTAAKDAAREESRRLREEARANKGHAPVDDGHKTTDNVWNGINNTEMSLPMLGSSMSFKLFGESESSVRKSSGSLNEAANTADTSRIRDPFDLSFTKKRVSEKRGHEDDKHPFSTSSLSKAVDSVPKKETIDAKPHTMLPNQSEGAGCCIYSSSKESNATENDRQQIEAAWKAAEDAKRAASNREHREQVGKDVKGPGEPSAQLAAMKARDARDEVDRRRREEQRKADERRRYEESMKARDMKRDEMKKNQQHEKVEEDAVNMRSSALEKLQKAYNPAADKKTMDSQVRQDQQEVRGTASVSQRMNALIAKSSMAEQQAEKSAQGTGFVAQPTPNSNNTQIESPTTSPEDIARQERIRAKESRNARMRQAEMEEDIEPQVLDDTPSVNVQTGPISLNSAVHQGMVFGQEKGDSSIPRPMGTHRESKTDARTSHERSLGKISVDDIKLCKWIDIEGIAWSQIPSLYERAFTLRRTVKTLRKRYRQVKEAVDEAGVDDSLLDLVAEGDLDAIAQLNAIVHGVYPLPTVAGRARDSRGHFISSPQTTSKARSTNQDQHWSSSATLSFESKTPTEPITPRSDSAQPTVEAERPQYGGKTLNEEAMMYYLEGCCEEYQKMQEEEAGRQQSPFAEQDYYCYSYQVQRRYVEKDEIDCGTAIEDVVWSACGDEYDNLTESYRKAEIETTRYRLDFEAMGDDEWVLRPSKTEDGFRLFTLMGEIAGTAQVRIVRFTRTYLNGKLPESKEGWAPRTLYVVVNELMTKDEDELFGEGEVEISDILLKDGIHTDLEMANERAADIFVGLTFSAKSRNLVERDIEKQREKKKWLGELDEGEMFCKRAGGNGTIRVKEERLNGPRNILR